jgi:hypothetical protein
VRLAAGQEEGKKTAFSISDCVDFRSGRGIHQPDLCHGCPSATAARSGSIVRHSTRTDCFSWSRPRDTKNGITESLTDSTLNSLLGFDPSALPRGAVYFVHVTLSTAAMDVSRYCLFPSQQPGRRGYLSRDLPVTAALTATPSNNLNQGSLWTFGERTRAIRNAPRACKGESFRFQRRSPTTVREGRALR